MDGLRIYVERSLTETAGGVPVFYSRRAEGPFYRWCYEREPKQWRVARVHSSDFSAKSLSMSRWKTVPAALQSCLTDHYQE